jgi:hypothetical protein
VIGYLVGPPNPDLAKQARMVDITADNADSFRF